ncbi:hypothetical protein QFZ25_001020 [Bacillus atrophaeus]|nr:hypothetical protein [Bacillus atrophaeus]MDQ0926960.1 hypothetical protein [Bacillus atrophaeus]
MPMSDAALSVLTEKDVPGLFALCRHAGWPGYDERELGLLLQNDAFLVIRIARELFFLAPAFFHTGLLLRLAL